MKREHRGFTLIELLISVVIGGILFLTVGIIIVYAQVALQKAINSVDLSDDYRTFRRSMELEMRGATSKPYYFQHFTADYTIHNPADYSIDPFMIDSANSIRFITLDPTLNKFKGNRVYADGSGNIVYSHWYARTTGVSPNIHIWLNVANKDAALPSGNDVVLRNLTSLLFALAGSPGYENEAVRVDTQQQRVIDPTSGATRTEQNSFTVKTRQKRPH